jgi:hypothetical protein
MNCYRWNTNGCDDGVQDTESLDFGYVHRTSFYILENNFSEVDLFPKCCFLVFRIPDVG